MKKLRDFPRTSNFSKDQAIMFNDYSKLLRQNKVPTWMVNPSLILSYNECHSEKDQIGVFDKISLGSILLLGCDGAYNLNAKQALRHSLRQPRGVVDSGIYSTEDITVRHDPQHNKLHSKLDELEDKE